MRILVTGGAGFLGSALANTLAQQGHEVLVVDDLSAGDLTRLHKQVLFHRGSVLDRPKLWTLLHGVECVYHLAARVLVAESILYPYDYNKVNVGGTVMLLEAMRDLGIPRLVIASSGAIYGEQNEQPISEAAPPNPRSPYAVSKLAAEHYAQTIGAIWGIATTTLRIFNVYGPGQSLPPSHPPVVPRFLQQASGDGSVVIFGDGTQTRDFVYLDDVVTALITAGTTDRIGGQTFNIGSGRDTSINQLSKIILAITKSESNIIYNAAGSVGVSRLQANITAAQKYLGYTPQVSLESGLRQTLHADARF